MKRFFWQPIESFHVCVTGRVVLHETQLLFIHGREGNDWKNKNEESGNDYLGTLFHKTSMSLPRNTNRTWSTSCLEPKRRHTDCTWVASSSCLRNRMTCLFADEGCRNRTPWTEEMECCLPIIVTDKEHIASLEAYSTSPPCSRHSWCNTDGIEDPGQIDDTRNSYHWNTNLGV